ncbi:X-ray repair cross-complementing protein 5 [Plodia interpunctella]|uniref:X-ray repair cross-complementing protein 5 n=1 Tax=Plodia interpunctella TaxID=58824 RepID=UPI002367CA77|nr:X-ray repair cross-complementing protein 5 [Plodia interpunctella]
MGSDDEYEEDPTWKGIPATIILINAFNDTNVTKRAHSAVCQMLREYLRLTSTQYISVCFYGVKNPNTSNISFQDVIEVMPLTAPTLADYKKVLELDFSKFDKPDELKLSEALWFCSNMFEKCKKQLISRTVIIMSKLDVPPTKSDEKYTYTRVTDLVNTDSLYSAEIKIINMSHEDYKVDVFFQNFAIDAKTIIPKPVWDCKEIEKLILQQSHRNLAVAQLNFEIGNGFEIGVGVYTLLKSTYQPKKVKLNRDTNALITTVNKTMKVNMEPTETDPNEEPMDEEESIEQKAVPLLKSEIVYYQEYGGEKVQFTNAEKKAIDNPFGPPMLKLLGFKPASMLCKEKWFLKPGYFLYPNENRIEGSTTAFRALHQACTEMSVVAICILCTRVNSRPNIVALSPSSQPLNLNVEIGFDVIHIPFVENVRDIPPVDDDDTSDDFLEDQKKVLKEIINSIKFQYKPDMFEDPKVQSLYRNIEAIAFSEEDVEPFHDTTKPSQEAFQNLPEDAFEELFGPFGEAPLKRTISSKDGEVRSKKTKVNNIDDSMLQIQISSQQVHKYTVDQLKQILRSKDISGLPALTGMKKEQLVNLVYQHFS